MSLERLTPLYLQLLAQLEHFASSEECSSRADRDWCAEHLSRALRRLSELGACEPDDGGGGAAVSYTHLTLPTICSV